MIFTPPSTATGEWCIKRPDLENLSVIPYVKGRLVFAQLVARAIRDEEFDHILVDLPHFFNGGGLADFAVSLFPVVSSLVIRNAEGEMLTIPFTPSDAACAAVAAVRMSLNEPRSRCFFVDDSQVINYTECLDRRAPGLQDDYQVFRNGLTAYFTGPWSDLENQWSALEASQQFFLQYRAGRVADRVAKGLEAGKKSLLVCEYRLWNLVSKALDGRVPGKNFQVPVNQWKRLRGALVLEDPCRLWTLGVMDDYPRLVEEFCYAVKSRFREPFDKLEALEALIRNCLSGKQVKPSNRRLISLRHYLLNRMCSESRMVPLPVSHLYDAVLSCAGESFADALAERFLRYSTLKVDAVRRFLDIHDDQIIIGGMPFDLPDLDERANGYGFPGEHGTQEKSEDLKRLLNKVQPALSPNEREELTGEIGSVEWELELEYQLHEAICRMTREKVKTEESGSKIKRSWSTREIHMKRTMISRARKENRIYVRVKNTDLSARRSTSLSEATPNVFIFEDVLPRHNSTLVHDSNITRRRIELGEKAKESKGDPRPDAVYSVYATYARRETLCEGHIRRHHLSSLSMLYSKHMGVQRYLRITGRAKKFQCRIDPRGDPDLKGFSISELGVAWAVKYAERYVIVAAKNEWAPSEKLSLWLRIRGVEIIKVPLSKFPPKLIDRMRVMHCISTALKKHPMRETIVGRCVS